MRKAKVALILLGGVCVIAVASYASFVWYVANVEQPDYRSIKRAAAFELRDYPPLVVAEVTPPTGRLLSGKAFVRWRLTFSRRSDQAKRSR